MLMKTVEQKENVPLYNSIAYKRYHAKIAVSY